LVTRSASAWHISCILEQMPSTGLPGPKSAGSHWGAPSEYTLAGPPERMMPFGANSRTRAAEISCRRHDISAARVRELAPKGIILSGGPASVYSDGAPQCDPALFGPGSPVLGICSRMQLMCQALADRVTR